MSIIMVFGEFGSLGVRAEAEVNEVNTEYVEEETKEDAGEPVAEEAANDVVWKVPAADWYEDYEYQKDDAGKKIILKKPVKTLSGNIVVPGAARIGTEDYSVVIAHNGGLEPRERKNNSFWYDTDSNISGIKLESGVSFAENDCSQLFAGMFGKLKVIDISAVDFSKVTDMSGMFYCCTSLEEINLGDFDTSKVTTMKSMFDQCGSLKSIDAAKFETSNVTDMSSMFCACNSLETLDVSGFDTSKVTNMNYMFSCKKVKILDVSHFDTSKVTSMQDMFSYCEGLTSIDVSGFNTSAVTDMWSLFYSCKNLESIDITTFDTSKVKVLSRLFARCEKLKSIDLSKLDMSSCESIEGMFEGCVNLESVDLSKFNTSKVSDMHELFCDCEKLKEIDLSGFDTSQVITMGRMFCGCYNLETLKLGSFDTSNCKNMYQMFSGCRKLTKLDVSGFKTSKVTDMSSMFSGCPGLTELDVSRFDTSAAESMTYMFEGCEGLAKLELRNFVISESCRTYGMLRDSAENIYLPSCWKKDKYYDEQPDELKNWVRIKKIYFYGSKEAWDKLGYEQADGVEIIFNYTQDMPEPPLVVEEEKTEEEEEEEEKTEEEQRVEGPSPMNPVPVIDKDTKELYLVKGQKFTLPEGEWKSSNTKKLKISKTGLLTAKKKSDTPIVLSKGEQNINVYITQPVMVKKSFGIESGGVRQIDINYDKAHLGIRWYSASPDIAEVDASGKLTARSKGTAVITAYINGSAYKCKVKVKESIAAAERKLHLTVGDPKSLKIKGLKKPVWNVSDNSIAVFEKGKVKALKAGETTLTTENNGKKYIVHVYAEDPVLSGTGITSTGKNKYSLNIKLGEKLGFNFAKMEQTVIFASGKGDIAFADINTGALEGFYGYIQANHKGKAKLTAKVNGKKLTISVNVE